MIVAIDFETALLAPGLQAPPPVCMSAAVTQSEGSEVETKPPLSAATARIQCPTGEGFVFCTEAARHFLKAVLSGPYRITGLNLPFDLSVACEAFFELLPLVFEAYDQDRITDVSTRQKLIDIALGEDRHGLYGLASLAKDLLGRTVEKEDTWRLRYWELAHLPLTEWPYEALEYSASDAVTTLDLYQAQENSLIEIDRLCVLEDQYRQSRADFVLRLISAWGLRSDLEACKALRQGCEQAQKKLEDELLEAGLLKLKTKGRKPNKVVVGVSLDTKAAQQRILDTCAGDWDKVLLTDTGIKTQRRGDDWRQLKYIKKNAEACGDSGDPLLEKYTEYAQLGNLLSGFVKAIEQGTVTPIHSHFEVLLNTGRTSSKKPNVQNIRKREGSRECFVPREGFCYIGCDIDRAELHTLAQVCINLFGHSTLGDSLNAGIDPHTKFGARLAGCSYEDLKDRIARGDDTAGEMRSRAKPANFGLPGGMGPGGLQRYAKSMYRILLSDEQAQWLVNSWREEYPDIAGDYLGWIKNIVRGTGRGTIEHFDSKRWRGGCTFCVAANSFFQGMAADALKAALWELAKKCYLPGTALYGCRLVNEVHDEVLIEAPIDQASDAAWEVQRTMIAAYNTYTRDVPVNATPVLMDRWCKKAKPIIEDGVYRIWRYQGWPCPSS